MEMLPVIFFAAVTYACIKATRSIGAPLWVAKALYSIGISVGSYLLFDNAVPPEMRHTFWFWLALLGCLACFIPMGVALIDQHDKNSKH